MDGMQQKNEIKTIKSRKFDLKLSDADVKRIYKKAGKAGLSVEELLQHFIGDLVCGTYSNGSDERRLAGEWFSRCHFGMFPEKTFLRFLIENSLLDNFIGAYEYLLISKEGLEYAATHGEEYDDDEIESLKEDLSDFGKETEEIFTEFQKWTDEKTGTIEEEAEKILSWHKSMELMLNVTEAGDGR